MRGINSTIEADSAIFTGDYELLALHINRPSALHVPPPQVFAGRARQPGSPGPSREAPSLAREQRLPVATSL